MRTTQPSTRRHDARSARLALGTLVSCALAAVWSPALPAADHELRLAHVTSDQEPIQEAMEQFVEQVEQRSDGAISIDIFPNASLGTNAEVYEQMRAGAPIMTISDPGYLSDFVADFGVLGGPYLMEDPMRFSQLIESDLYTGLVDRLRDESGIELLALNWFFGARHLIADEAVSGPDDIAGMAVRTPPNAMWVETFEAMGARPTQLPWAEVYSGLSAGVVDAAEAPLPSIHGAKLMEVKKTISLTGHFKGFTGLVMNSDLFAGMPEALRTILSEEAVAAGEYMTELMLSSEQEWIEKLEAQGVSFNSDVDVAAFAEQTASVYAQFPDWTPGLFDEVRAILDR